MPTNHMHLFVTFTRKQYDLSHKSETKSVLTRIKRLNVDQSHYNIQLLNSFLLVSSKVQFWRFTAYESLMPVWCGSNFIHK